MILIDPLVTIDEAKGQLNLKGSHQFDSELQMMMEQATGIIVQYVNDADVTDLWTLDTVPAAAHHAILLQLTWMFQHRGDEVDTDGIAPGVETLLGRTRKQAIA